MYREIAKLVLYRNNEPDSILHQLSEIFKDYDEKRTTSSDLIDRIYGQIKALLDLSTQYGFDENLWQNYLTYLLLSHENSFSLTSEKIGINEGSVNTFAKHDFKIFMSLFHFDFSKIEAELGIDCFSVITAYKAIEKKERLYNKNVSVKVRETSRKLAATDSVDTFYSIVTTFYKDFGVGILGLNKAFRIAPREDNVEFMAINNTEAVMLKDIIGYEYQKKQLTDNTEAFVAGRPANNVLLFGDAGTGKSTSIKALINEYYKDGLRMIEIYKHQFKDLSKIIAQIKNRNYKFIIYMDDLSFEEFEIEYKYLKAIIEGGVETKPDNVLIYATSNRRHLIRETWGDRSDASEEELHHSDTVQEKLSLVARFGISISFSKPNQAKYFEIVKGIAARYPEITLSEEELLAEARKWELQHSGFSGRTAQQFVTYLLSRSNA
jgi:predicted AAA+ superfamily ATPase